MRKLTLLIILLIGSFSYGQTILYQNAPDRQKIAFDTITGDISLQNSPSINIGPYVRANATIPIIFEDASNKTIGPDDNSKFFLNRSNNNYTYIVQNQANGGYDNSTLAYTFGVDSTLAGFTGKVFIKGETGSGVDPRQISTPESAATLIRRGANDWIWNGTSAVPWEWNIYQVANALATPEFEANSITGITDRTEWKASSVSSNPDPYEGNWCMVFTHGGPDNTAYSSTIDLTGLEIGASYKIGMWVYKMNAQALGASEIYVFTDHWDSLVMIAQINAIVPQGEWLYYENTAIPKVTNPTIRVSAGSTSDTGHRIALKSLTIEKVTP